MRRHVQFECKGHRLAGSLDEGRLDTGLLIVSGGNELRSGAHRGMARLATRLTRDGFPVFRFDRRGVGDSEGDNSGFLSSGPDIRAATAAFRDNCPGLERIVAFGNCDAATALALHHEPNDIAALLLSNPWVIEGIMPHAAALRRRYWERLHNPRKVWELLTGGVNLTKLAKGLYAARSNGEESVLARKMAAALAQTPCLVSFILAERDNSAMAFEAAWEQPSFRELRAGGRVRLVRIPTASHSFARPEDAEALYRAVRNMLHHVAMG